MRARGGCWTLLLCVLPLSAIASSTDLAAPVKAKTSKDTCLYAKEVPVLATVRKTEHVQILDERGAWCLIRYSPSEGAPVEGLVRTGALVKLGTRVEVLRDTPLYATSRPVLATIANGTSVEVLSIVPKGYVVRYSPEDGEAYEGLVPSEAISETDEIKVLKAEIAKAVAERAKEQAEARQAEALYQKWKYKYALVDGEYVRLPDFQTQRKCSRCGGKKFVLCSKCQGRGMASVERTSTCSACGGTGKLLAGTRCTRCGGSGTIRTRRNEVCDQCRGRKIVTCPRCQGTGLFSAGELHSISMGAFGALHDCSILQILDDNNMLVSWGGQWRVLYFTGWATADFADGDLLAPVEVAIIGTKRYTTVRGSASTVFHAIPLSQVRRGLSREQVRDLLARQPADDDGGGATVE